MPQDRTYSAIQKSKHTDVEQAKITKCKCIDYSRWNRCKNKEAYNTANREQMRITCAGMKDKEKIVCQDSQRASSKKYYLKNRTEILQKAKDKCMSAHMKKFGPDSIWWYKMCKGTLQTGLRDKEEGVGN
ncbi:hypothetical protein BT96DRAFT_948476 [Gymnopus androsaceus JB14]|uniref:Uncharacterized protein n=1 Tax=Gymnopus androsaceus JB14 TaxID=1447944 RepID=A0A6A4GPM7_9AGAR|nr:hypothetical protein BT96DRAFT_948476 [Gymnopus androsaceus JB14]